MSHSTLELTVVGMTCAGCERHVSDALRGADGVLAVTSISHADGRAVVDLAGDADVAAVAAAATEAGYPAQVLRLRRPAGEQGRRSLRADRDFDLVIVGSGSASFAAAIAARELGRSVAMVEEGTLGGTCVNVGCVPSKYLIRAAEARYHATHHGFPGVATSAGPPDWAALLAEKDAFVDALRQAKYESVLDAYAPIELVRGRGTLLGTPEGHVDVLVGARRIKAGKVLVATGGAAWAPPIPGLEAGGWWTSTEALAAPEVPARLLVLGGSAVGLETAQTLARFGARVTVVELAPTIVPLEDPEVGPELARHLQAEGITVVTSAQIRSAERTGRGWALDLSRGGQTDRLEGDALLVATGRRPNTRGLGLEGLGIELGRRGGVVTDATQRSSHPDVYAAGDVTDAPMFVYVAAYLGNLAARNMFGDPAEEADLSALPKVTFTDPQVASVGLTEAQARAAGHDVIVSRLGMENVPRAIVNKDVRGFIKLIADAETDRLLGAHIVAAEAGEMIQEATLMLKYGLSVAEIGRAFHPYLTLSEGMKLACQMFRKDVKKLSCCAA